MRCKACNSLLSDAEARRKEKETGDYVDLCGACYYVSEDVRVGFYSDSDISLEEYLDPLLNEGA